QPRCPGPQLSVSPSVTIPIPKRLDHPRTRFVRDPRAQRPEHGNHHGGPDNMSSDRLKIYTTTSCGDCRMAKTVLDRAGVDYEEIDLDRDPDAVATVLAINGGYTTVPTIVMPD